MERSFFQTKRFDANAMVRFGFCKTGGTFCYETDILDGAFHAVLTVSDGLVTGKVIDCMNGEEYAPLRLAQYRGAYVNRVRAAYEEVLKRVAAACCYDVPFASDQANRIAARIAACYTAMPDFPWNDRCGVFRHAENAKWFALVMPVKRRVFGQTGADVEVVNLKRDPAENTERAGVFPAYHMNHRTWISVLLDDTLSDDEVFALVEESFRLTRGK